MHRCENIDIFCIKERSVYTRVTWKSTVKKLPCATTRSFKNFSKGNDLLPLQLQGSHSVTFLGNWSLFSALVTIGHFFPKKSLKVTFLKVSFNLYFTCWKQSLVQIVFLLYWNYVLKLLKERRASRAHSRGNLYECATEITQEK